MIQLSYQRINRIAEEIRKEISSIIMYELKDPRISEMVTVIKAEVTKDLRYASIYVGVFGTDEVKNKTIEALKGASGFIRKELGSRLDIRYIPELQFKLDNSVEYSLEINKILKEINENKGDN